MRRFVRGSLSLQALACMTILAAGSSANVEADSAGASLLRTTLTVADVDRSTRFYALLGFVVESEMGGERDPDSAFPLNSRSSRWRLVILAPASGEGGKIGLLSFEQDTPAPVRPMTRDRVGLGDMVFVFDVPDALATHASLKAAAANIVEDPVTYRSSRTDAD